MYFADAWPPSHLRLGNRARRTLKAGRPERLLRRHDKHNFRARCVHPVGLDEAWRQQRKVDTKSPVKSSIPVQYRLTDGTVT